MLNKSAKYDKKGDAIMSKLKIVKTKPMMHHCRHMGPLHRLQSLQL